MDNETAPLPDHSDIDRVIDEENTKTFRVSGPVLFLDDRLSWNGDRYEGAEVYFNNPVPVKNAEGKVIGAAALSVEGKVVEAEMFLDYHTPERLDIETKSKKLFPSIAANEAVHAEKGEGWRVYATFITDIYLSEDEQPDVRVDPLG